MFSGPSCPHMEHRKMPVTSGTPSGSSRRDTFRQLAQIWTCTDPSFGISVLFGAMFSPRFFSDCRFSDLAVGSLDQADSMPGLGARDYPR